MTSEETLLFMQQAVELTTLRQQLAALEAQSTAHLVDANEQLKKQLAEAQKEATDAEQTCDALHIKLRSLTGGETCGCSYDKPGDVCMHHSPKLVEAEREIAALKLRERVHREELNGIRENVTHDRSMYAQEAQEQRERAEQAERDRDFFKARLVNPESLKQQEVEIGRLRRAIAETDPLDLHDARVSPPEYLCRFCFGIGVYEKLHKPDCVWLHAEDIATET